MNRQALLSLDAIISILLLLSTEAGAQEHNAPKVEVGPQFSSLSINSLGFNGTENVAGFGGRVTYNLNDHFAVEAVGNIFPMGSEPQFVSGGTMQQAQFGIKVGKRYNRFGVFAKVRPGFVSFGNTTKLTSSLVQRVSGGVFSTFTEYTSERKTTKSRSKRRATSILDGAFQLPLLAASPPRCSSARR